MGSWMIFSGVFSATSSMFMPPSVLAMIAWRAARAVEEDGEVEFLRDVDGFGDEHLAHELALRAGLVRDERLAEHLAREVPRLARPCSTRCTPPLKPFLNVPLPRPPAWICAFTTRPSCRRVSRATAAASSGGAGDAALGRGDAEFLEEFLGLVFVDVHGRSGPGL